MIGTTLNGRFTLEKELGRGGMGAVYRAADQVLQRNVAIKVLKDLHGEEVGRRIRLEAQILARLLHENIVRLYDFNADGETYYFIMEEVDGTSFFRRWRKIEIAERLRILIQTAEALDYAHRQGVIHRDVKPANILLTAADAAKLSDFGLSLMSDATQESGIVRGTPHYMSPEQAKGMRLDHRSDLYALGVILYECAVGSPPYQGTAMTVMAQHVNAEPEPPRSKNPEISEACEALVLSLMAKNPANRPATGREVAERIRALPDFGANGAATPSGLVPAAGPAPTPGQRSGGTDWAGASEISGTGGGSAAAGAEASLPAVSREVTGTAVLPSVAARKTAGSAVARAMLEAITAEPIQLSADERYLAGHYLGYLLGGSRRRGFLLRRPLDPLNADRARLMLAMTALTLPGDAAISMEQAASLMDSRPDVRPSLSPIVIVKYLTHRDTPAKRKRFRQVRQQLQQASDYATRNLTDDRGVLNPGLMPQVLADLQRLAPARTEVDDQLVHRWNQVTEVWRGNPEFREAVLRYATKGAWRDPASLDLWPEVVYPLIERARRQRLLRSGLEAFYDEVCAKILHLPDAGVRMDRAIKKAVPAPVVDKLDISLEAFEDEPEIEEPAPEATDRADEPKFRVQGGVSPASFHDIEVEAQPTRNLIRLATPEPFRQTLGELRTLWQEAIAAMRTPSAKQGHKHIAVGPYRLTVVASIRNRSAGQVAIQGMPNKQIELLIPAFAGAGANTKPVVAVWHYPNGSLAITYIDHLNAQRYILWDSSVSQQTNFDDAGEFNHALYQIGLEVPDALDRVLSKGYRPKNPV